MPEAADWYAVFVSDPERFERATGCAARLGELYAVTPARGIAADGEYGPQGLSKRPLERPPDGDRVRWNAALRAFEPARALPRLWWRVRRLVKGAH
jgi:hypothetical protein